METEPLWDLLEQDDFTNLLFHINGYGYLMRQMKPRSIEELYRLGFNAKAVKKGPDSIKFGIGVLQNYKLNILKTSQNLINEMYSYQYATDKNGYTTDIPEGGLDHLLDALRYVGMMKLSMKATAKGKYAITIGNNRY